MGFRSLVGGLALLGIVANANATTPTAPTLYAPRPDICAHLSENTPYDSIKVQFNGPVNPEAVVERFNPMILTETGYNGKFDRISLSNVPSSLTENYQAELLTHPEVCFSSPQTTYRTTSEDSTFPPYSTKNLDVILAADLQNTAEHRLWAENMVRNLPPNLSSVNGNEGIVYVPKGTAREFASWYIQLPEVSSVTFDPKR